ncbi:GNAT family N-acetyltransferase [Ectobacillus ponti]|uniref:GNAT family N-acetyltransferase n=1 Tax=Ectobacillus ponti TaxID=2961894 RepID=A0AA41X7Q4_9BACI|nr:GNAT family N-acetyltransferase [Ectobacillus ponti]MCP8968420.1 GNAT family N-acetyltransferase [Ectobacillus ponti]
MFVFQTFYDLTDGEIQLIPWKYIPADERKGFVPAYEFSIAPANNAGLVMGKIVLRVGDNENTLYGGHIGYLVKSKFRGNSYAARACLLIRKVAAAHGMKTLIISCNPNNIPSRRTCEKAGARLRDIIEVPPHHDLYQRGERETCIYEMDVQPIGEVGTV